MKRRQPVAKTRRPRSKKSLGPLDRPAEPLSVAEALALPALNGPQTICRLWNFSPSQFHRLNREGAFDFLKVVPSVGPKQFSGVLIHKYISAEFLMVSSFGRRKRGCQ